MLDEDAYQGGTRQVERRRLTFQRKRIFAISCEQPLSQFA